MEGSPPPFIAWIGRFPASLGMETLATTFGRAREGLPPKLGVPGGCPGSAEPHGATSRTSFGP
jgi:hypothetical protein